MEVQRIFILSLLLTLLFSMALPAMHVVAQDDDDTEEEETDDEEEYEDDEEEFENEEREVEIEVDEDSAEISSKREYDDTEDEFEIEIDVKSDAEIKLEYSSENDTSELEAEMKVVFIELIEFNDTDGDGVYTEDNDTEVQTYDMSDVEYADLVYTTESTDNGTIHHINATTTDGVFTFITHITESFTQLNSTNVKPTELKIDILINNFDFQSESSKLALYNKVESTQEREIEQNEESPGEEDEIADEEEKALVQSGSGIFAFYSWQETAQVDGQTTAVDTSLVENTETEKKLYLNYEQGDEIIHDPKLGVNIDGVTDDTTSASDTGDTNFSWLLSLSLLSLLALPVIRKKSRKITQE